MTYIIDTSAILDGRARYYPPEVFPALWHKVEDLIARGEIVSTEEVFHEIAKKDDDAYTWAKTHRAMFVPIDAEIQEAVRIVLVKYPRLVQEQRNRSSGDPWVVALAIIKQGVVVTGERRGSPNRPRIPDVCDQEKIVCIDLLGMMRRENWAF